jgi:hypothetical protein
MGTEARHRSLLIAVENRHQQIFAAMDHPRQFEISKR